ncbi:MAG: diacylglycerol kinase family lipid kinase [Verrucomicrobia bacterium]|nr:diacylglycerol kinase family lipid kinase [Verrucomicrobiota bacterium]
MKDATHHPRVKRAPRRMATAAGRTFSARPGRDFVFSPRLRMKCRFILNPRSGHNARNPHLLEAARQFIRERRIDGTVVATTHARHATALARQAVDEGCTLVVAIGGDGTMNEVAAALVDSTAVLGLIPCGSGNGLGRHLGIRHGSARAFHTLLDGRVRRIDTGTANGQPFFNVMGMGFDADLSARFNQLHRRGLRAYIATTLQSLRAYRPRHYRIRIGDVAIEEAAFLVAVANSDQYGNDCFIAPRARVDDGQLDLTLIRPVRLRDALPLAVRLFTRSVERSPRAVCQRATAFTIECGEPGYFHTDGEVHETPGTLHVAIKPASLAVQVPHAG